MWVYQSSPLVLHIPSTPHCSCAASTKGSESEKGGGTAIYTLTFFVTQPTQLDTTGVTREEDFMSNSYLRNFCTLMTVTAVITKQ